MEFLLIFLLIWGGLSWAVAHKATSRGRSFTGFLLLSIFTSPLLGIIVLLVMRDLKADEVKEAALAEAAAERERVRKEEHEKQLEALRAITGAASIKGPVSDAQSTAPSVADEITKLAQLLDRGVLTAEEFAEQKAALLKPRP